MQDLEDKFYIDDDKTLHFEYDVSVQGCVDAYENLNNTKQSIVNMLIEKMQNNEKLTPKAYKIIFENIDYESTEDALEFIKELMSYEKNEKLLQLDKFELNAVIIAKLYMKAMDIYVKSDLSKHLNDEIYLSIPDTYCTCLINFFVDMKLTTEEHKEWMNSKIKYWKFEIGKQFASILYNTYTYHSEGISKETFNHWCDLILDYYSRDNEIALKIKQELKK